MKNGSGRGCGKAVSNDPSLRKRSLPPSFKGSIPFKNRLPRVRRDFRESPIQKIGPAMEVARLIGKEREGV